MRKRMIKIAMGFFWGSFLILLLACRKEQTIPVDINFNYTVVNDDYSVPSRITINNRTANATWYQWNFEGGIPASSDEKTPGIIAYKKAGTYPITLKAGNDFGEVEKTIELILDDSISANFNFSILQNSFAPVTIQLNNRSYGATTYSWLLPGGDPASSTEQQPGAIVYDTPGEYPITLRVSNGREQHVLNDTLVVLDSLKAQFNDSVDYMDLDYEVPVTVYFSDQSVSAITTEWHFEGGSPVFSTQSNPVVTYSQPGKYRVTFQASNDKTIQTVTRQYEFFENRNLIDSKNVRFSVFSGRNSVGSFYSTETGKVYTEDEFVSGESPFIDLVFFGMDSSFVFNQFISPSQAEDYGFINIPNAKYTRFINSQEYGSASAVFSEDDFEQLTNGASLDDINFDLFGDQGKLQFTNAMIPRIVLFETSDGKRGAIKIKQFITNNNNAYILTDIKVQKE